MQQFLVDNLYHHRIPMSVRSRLEGTVLHTLSIWTEPAGGVALVEIANAEARAGRARRYEKSILIKLKL